MPQTQKKSNGRISFVRFYPSDWRSGCLGLTLEQEGLYIRICAFIAEANRRIPLDDTEAAKMLGTQTRNYRRVLGELLRLGKIQRHGDGYSNDRIERERAKAAKAQLDAKADDTDDPGEAVEQSEGNADQGQERKNSEPPLNDGQPSVTPVYSRYNGVITGVASEIREQNQRPVLIQEPELYSEVSEVENTARSESVAARETSGRTAAYGDLKKAFNGSTEAMLETIDAAMGGHARPNAEKWLAATIGAHGAPAVAQAFAMLIEKQATGQIVPQPLALWSKIAGSLKTGARDAAGDSRKPEWAVERDRKRAEWKAAMQSIQ